MRKAIITAGYRKGETGKLVWTRLEDYMQGTYYIIELDDPFWKVPLYVHESRVRFLHNNYEVCNLQ